MSESINSYLKKNTFHNAYLSYAQIGGCILSCPAVADYAYLVVNNGTVNVRNRRNGSPCFGGGEHI